MTSVTQVYEQHHGSGRTGPRKSSRMAVLIGAIRSHTHPLYGPIKAGRLSVKARSIPTPVDVMLDKGIM